MTTARKRLFLSLGRVSYRWLWRRDGLRGDAAPRRLVTTEAGQGELGAHRLRVGGCGHRCPGGLQDGRGQGGAGPRPAQAGGAEGGRGAGGQEQRRHAQDRGHGTAFSAFSFLSFRQDFGFS